MFKKVTSLLLALLILFPLLTSCITEKPQPEPIPTPPQETIGTIVDIVANAASDYNIYYPDGKENTTEYNAAIRLSRVIKLATGCELTVQSDRLENNESLPQTAKEILIGSTNRLESSEALSVLRDKDYSIFFQNDRIVIVGGTPSETTTALNYFIDHYINLETKKVSVPNNLSYSHILDYPIGIVNINGIPLKKYCIVYPENCDLLTRNIADCLAEYILEIAGLGLQVVSDATPESSYELLVGNTNRKESREVAKTTCPDDRFLLCQVDNKVVMLGKDYLVGAAASELVNTHLAAGGHGVRYNCTTLPTTPTPATFAFKKATSAILFIGDGMGLNHINATLKAGLNSFDANKLPNVGTVKTFSDSVAKGKSSYTDSAAAATALATGYKTTNGWIGMSPDKVSRQNVRELAYSSGAMTGIITTDAITGATPAGFLCHHNDRNGTAVLQSQIDKLITNKQVNYCKGSVGDNLLKNTKEALSLFNENDSNFFMMIEEAYVDKYSHNNNLTNVTGAVKRANTCISYLIAYVVMHQDIALIVTADHETGGIIQNKDGSFRFTSTNHTNTDVGVYGIGEGTDSLINTGSAIDNTDIAKFIAKIFGAEQFGQNVLPTYP